MLNLSRMEPEQRDPKQLLSNFEYSKSNFYKQIEGSRNFHTYNRLFCNTYMHFHKKPVYNL